MKFCFSPFITPSATPHPPRKLGTCLAAARSHSGENNTQLFSKTLVPLRYLKGKAWEMCCFQQQFQAKQKSPLFTNQPPKERHKLASFVQREVARLAVTEGLFKAQGHLIRHSFVVTPSPTGEGLGDVMLSITICNKAKVLAFYQSTAERTA